MNGRKAKAIRRAVYGTGHHPGPVLYGRQVDKQCIIADKARQHYRLTKKKAHND